LNPASLLPSEQMTEHMCEQVIVLTYASRPDLTDKPLLKPEDKWFIDGSSFVLNSKRKAEYAVMSQGQVTEALLLPAGTKSPKARVDILD
jgi:hypothetical protein